MSAEQPCVLAVMAHPDDIEFVCAGTLARLEQAGWRVAMATMTAGDCGSISLPPEGISGVRRGEAAAAAALLGADYHCVGELDLLVFLNGQTVRRVVELLRRVQPDLVITHSPVDYMLDHEQTSTIVRSAAFGCPIRNFLTGVDQPAPVSGQVPHLYYADAVEGLDLFGRRLACDLWIDIGAQIQLKEQMLATHASQREWLLKHHGMDEYLRSMRAWSQTRGAEVGVTYAEGFRQHRGHAYPATDLLGDTLGALRP